MMAGHEELLADVIRAEAAGEDLQEGPFGIHVCAMRKDGELYELGSVSESMVFQDPKAARIAISKIKFARFKQGSVRRSTGSFHRL